MSNKVETNDHTSDMPDIPDIIETPEMTDEAQETLEYIFEDRMSKIEKMKVSADGGVIAMFNITEKEARKLIISGNGKKCAFGTVNSNGDKNVTFYGEMDREKLKAAVLLSFGLEREDLPSSNLLSGAETTTEPLPLIIKLKKGFSDQQITSFIHKLDQTLGENHSRISRVRITTEEWKNSTTPYQCIPGAKKLFARFSERGLLACLALNGYGNDAKELFCNAYEKGKVVEGGIQYKNSPGALSRFRNALVDSAKALHGYTDEEVRGLVDVEM